MESRSPSQSSMEYEPPDNPLEEEEQPKLKYQFSIANIPEKWSRKFIKKFIIETVNSKHVSQNMDLHKKFINKQKMNVVKFCDKEAAEEAYEVLKDVVINGKKLSPTMLDVPSYSNPMPVSKPNRTIVSKKWKTCPAFFTGDFTNETFGLSVQFLEHLGIKPPLPPSIFVTNLPPDIDEKELQKTFSIAGKVVKIILKKGPDNTSQCKAIIVFDHPVEAVQAISMFNNQSLRGNILVISKDTKSKKAKILPSGLLTIGPGLGENGDALHNIRIDMEIEEIKRLIRDWLIKANNTNQNLNTNEKNKRTNCLNTNTQANRPSDLFQTLSHNLNPNLAANTNVQALLQGLIQQAHSVNAAQNTLQSVLTLMSNMGNQSTNQTLPVPATQMQQDNSVNALNAAQNPLQSVLALMSNMGNQLTNQTLQPANQIQLDNSVNVLSAAQNPLQSVHAVTTNMRTQSTNQTLPVPPTQKQQNNSVNALDAAQNPSQSVFPLMSTMGSQSTNQTLPVPVKQPVHNVPRPQFSATFTRMTNHNQLQNQRFTNVAPVRHTTHSQYPYKPVTLANSNIPNFRNRFGMMTERNDAMQMRAPKRCYTCRQVGHEAKDCRTNRRCAHCRNSSHTTEACWFANRAGSSQ